MDFNQKRRDGGSRTASNAVDKTRTRKLLFHKLQTLIGKHPEEILFTLSTIHSGFDTALAEDKISKDRMALILIALGKACSCDERNTVQKVLTKFNSSSKLIYGNIQQYLCSLQNDSCNDRHLESLSYLILILEELHKVLCTSSSDTLAILLPLFKSTVQKINKRNNNRNLTDIIHKIELLESDNDRFSELQFPKENNTYTKASIQQMENPPNDFRKITILPHDGDACLSDNPFLRPIIEDGRYQSLEHYLDVHFRLLHEDVLRPLREGIQEYIVSQKNNNPKKWLKDVKLYTGIRIQKPVMSMSGLTHLISFETKLFKNIAWENSKRLLFGSLLCLSHDNFKTMLFATVARRDSDKLKNGLLEIQFENPEEIFELNLLTNFVMIETNAYFEAYRHVLEALQKVTEDNFPLKEYIIDGKLNTEPPQYLTPETTYNFQSLLVQPSSEQASLHPETDVSSNFEVKNVLVMDTKMWPSELLGLDEYQLAALKTAVTKKLAIIQGPPGTGKTYIGLKIVELLLNNCNVWNSLDEISPILVVCYTNHALDQFLEGMLPITDNIVRVGGRSSNPNMHSYQLRTLRTQLRNQHKVPEHIFHNISESKLQMKDIQQKVTIMEKQIEAAINSVLTAETLKNHIKLEHYNSLISAIETYSSQGFDKSTIMLEWLGISSYESFFKMQDSKPHIDVNIIPGKDLKNEEIIDSDNEEYEDIEYIINERIVDLDDNDDITDHKTAGIDFPEIEQYEDLTESEWRVQGGYKQRKQFIKTQLQSADMMTVREANSVTNIWELNYVDRWRMYRMWIRQYVKDNMDKILETQKPYKQLINEFEEIRIQEDVNLMRDCKIVGMTTSGAAKYRMIVQKLKPPIIIVEEAAEVLEAHIIASLTAATQHLILIGDHRQLRPSSTVYELARYYNLDLSLFERMIKNGMECSKLYVQHRMRPCISELLVPSIYKDLHNHPDVELYEDIKGMEKNMFFISHMHQESSVEDSKSKHNIYEADFLVGLCRYLLLQGYSTSQITILTMYTGQMFLLKKKMKSSVFEGVRVIAVDNFQGEENDIILVSSVRSNYEGKIGFLGISNRICVALSRAKKGLYCIGNFSLLAEKSKIWSNITSLLTKNNMIGHVLKLKCQVHHEKITTIVKASDFKLKAPEGGCDSFCDIRLECGHSCTLSCHPYDREHKNFNCNKSCQKKCTNNHECPKKCHEQCGPCLRSILIKILSCNHTMSIKCSENPTVVICNKQCSLQLACGHQCTGICGKPCRSCNVIVKSLALCNHEVDIMCSKKDDEWEKLRKCKQPCNKELDCGHLCKGNCSLCFQHRIHIPCNEKCKRILVCGHECKFPCAENCPPCETSCENRCVHSYCPAKCGQKCSKCNEKCKWRCKHYECTEVCGNMCNRPPCDKRCQKQLKCGHQCIGLCGEQCPLLCRICNEDEVTEIFFGNEDEPNAQFVQLEDCKHAFEVTALTQYMKQKEDEIQMKLCPKCRVVIRKSCRFGNLIKARLQQIEMVKTKVFGLASYNDKQQKELLAKVKLLQENIISIKSTFQILNGLTTFKINISTVDDIVLNITDTLHESQKPHIQSLASMDNYLEFLDSIVEICKEFPRWYQSIENHKHSVEIRLWDFFSTTIQIILQTMNNNKAPTQQMLADINQEINRLKTFNALFQLIAKTCHTNKKPESFSNFYKKAVCKLLTLGPLKNDDIEMVKHNIIEASKQIEGIVLGISEEEKNYIVKAMGLERGHWFACPNGHVYCITECGGAMEESKCNECQATIGGRNHALHTDNRLASVMDNAQHAAWSDAANMLNYDWQNL